MLNDPLFAALCEGTYVITSNRRLVRHLRHLFDQHMMASGRTAWPTPTILSLDDWMSQHHAEQSRRFLTSIQSREVWESVIRADWVENQSVDSHTRSMADLASNALQLASHYQMDIDAPLSHFVSEEETAFARWSHRYRQACASLGWNPPELALSMMVNDAENPAIVWPTTIVWAGFDDTSLLLTQLKNRLTERGVRHYEWEPSPIKSTIYRHSAPSFEDEVRHCASWCRRQLSEGKTLIGVIIQDWGSYHRLIERIFSEELVPESALIDGDDERPYNISMGRPLAYYAVIQQALSLIRLDPDALMFADISPIIRSPYFGLDRDEWNEWALMESAMRRTMSACLTVDEWLAFLRTYKGPFRHRDEWIKRIQTWAKIRRNQEGNTAQAILRHYEETLSTLSWPGPRTLSSVDYQVLQSWKSVFHNIESLDLVTSGFSYRDLLRRLYTATNQHVFQPKGTTTPIQVLGMLESSGHQFDALYWMGLDQSRFPSSGRPNPFLSITEMKKRNMPHSSPDREKRYARAVLERITASAPEVVLSWSRRDGDAELWPSEMMAHRSALVATDEAHSHSVRSCWEAILDEKVERVAESPVVPLSTPVHVRGGSAVLKSQALCPFQAMAYYRLNAKPLDLPALGTDARVRGIIVHALLERFWREVKNFETFIHMSLDEITAMVERCVDDVWRETPELKRGPDWMHQKIDPLEKKRTIQLVLEWLEKEKERVPFTVKSTEEKVDVSIRGLALTIKVDRLDQLSDGSLVAIDYKTGEIAMNTLLGESLKEVQVPLYAYIYGHQLSASTYVSLKRNNMMWVGAGAVAGMGKCLETEEWALQREKWSRDIESLAEDFIHGKADVAPVGGKRTCQPCQAMALCGVYDKPVLDVHHDEDE